jgi:hypothetical protein
MFSVTSPVMSKPSAWRGEATYSPLRDTHRRNRCRRDSAPGRPEDLRRRKSHRSGTHRRNSDIYLPRLDPAVDGLLRGVQQRRHLSNRQSHAGLPRGRLEAGLEIPNREEAERHGARENPHEGAEACRAPEMGGDQDQLPLSSGGPENTLRTSSAERASRILRTNSFLWAR